MKQSILLLLCLWTFSLWSQDVEIVGNSYSDWQLAANQKNELFLLSKRGVIVMPLDSVGITVDLVADVVQNDTTFSEPDRMLFARILESSSDAEATPGTAIKMYNGFPNCAAILLLICDKQLATRFSEKDIKKMKRL